MLGRYFSLQDKLKKLLLLSIFLFSTKLFSQDFSNSQINYRGSGNYILQERSNLLRYDNGRYVGLVNKQVYAYITPITFDNYYIYEGNFYVQEGTKHNNYNVKAGIDDSIPSKFKINKMGQLTMLKDNGYPSFRSFPSYSDQKIQIGDSWSAKAERAVDPLNKGIITKLPIYVQYKYERDDYFNDEEIFVISAQWATRYGFGSGSYNMDFGGDKDLVKASGSHKANLYVSKLSGNCLLIQDNVDETFVYSDGNQYRFKGTISQFTEYPPAIDRSKIIPLLKRIAEISEEEEESLQESISMDEFSKISGDGLATAEDYSGAGNSTGAAANTSGTGNSTGAAANYSGAGNSTGASANLKSKLDTLINNPQGASELDDWNYTSASQSKPHEKDDKKLVTVDNTPAGLRLTIPNLQFKPNSPELMEDENNRLDKIAQVLLEIPDCRLLIEGHTARIGEEEGELQLSLERAQSIKNELSKRGFTEQNIIVRGSGGTKPIADNSTYEGRAKNRRVEITILE
ncbi:MAG: OmpA family protein [Treponema sp.]|nr:OmpA family protein [Treponema sp.]